MTCQSAYKITTAPQGNVVTRLMTPEFTTHTGRVGRVIQIVTAEARVGEVTQGWPGLTKLITAQPRHFGGTLTTGRLRLRPLALVGTPTLTGLISRLR
jgi:hypothetical protein